jgi:putative ABC transport system permease protein
MLDNFKLSLKQAFRSLLANKLYTLIVVTMLTLGISGTTVIFSVVNSILLRPLPYANADRVVYVWVNEASRGIERSPLSIPELQDYRSQNRTFDGLAGMFDGTLNVTFADYPEQLTATRISANLLDVLGTKPFLGRNFLPEEEVLGHNRVVLLSYRVWQRHFGGNPNVINQTIAVNGSPRVIVGIMPPGFRFPERDTDLWTPLALDPNQPNPREDRWATTVGLLKPGVTLEQAQADASTIAHRLEQEYPENRGVTIRLVPLSTQLFGEVKLPLQLLLGATLVILLIVCANVASLMLARAAVREREMSIRIALGAGRGRLIRQLMTESVLLALIAGVLGMLLSLWFVRLLSVYGTNALPQLEEVGVDRRALIFVAVVSLVTSLLFGLIPALQASKPDLQETLKEGRRSTTLSGGGRKLFNVLVVTEITLSLVLLIGAGLLLRSFVRLLRVDPGFDPANVLTMDMTLAGPKYQDPAAIGAFYDDLMRRIRALPGVQAAGATHCMPLGTGARYYMFMNSQDETDSTSRVGRPTTAFFQITPDYFQALATPILRGRAFTVQDDPQHQPVAIISERVAQFYFPNQDPLGKNIRLGAPGNWGQWLSVVGVVPDIRFEDLNNTPTMQVYTPHLQGLQVGRPSNRMVLAVRTSVDPTSLINVIKQQIWSLDKNQPISRIRPMSQIVSDSLAQRRLIMLLLVTFAGMALSLAVIGLYGTLSYMVTQRRHEIATRMALGAQQRDVLALIIRQGMVLVAIGAGLGLFTAYLATRLVATLLYGVSPNDPLTFAGVAVLIAVVSLLASFFPAYRATKVNPLKVLRNI